LERHHVWLMHCPDPALHATSGRAACLTAVRAMERGRTMAWAFARVDSHPLPAVLAADIACRRGKAAPMAAHPAKPDCGHHVGSFAAGAAGHCFTAPPDPLKDGALTSTPSYPLPGFPGAGNTV